MAAMQKSCVHIVRTGVLFIPTDVALAFTTLIKYSTIAVLILHSFSCELIEMHTFTVTVSECDGGEGSSGANGGWMLHHTFVLPSQSLFHHRDISHSVLIKR